MKAKNCTFTQIEMAVEKINEKYAGNIQINPDNDGVKRFTLRPVSSKASGSSKNPQTGRRKNACCWHVHGDFFDALFEIAPDAIVTSLGKKITKDEGNWKDYNIGSILYPAMASAACDCAR